MFILLMLACQPILVATCDSDESCWWAKDNIEPRLKAPWWSMPDVLLCDTMVIDEEKVIEGFDNWLDTSDEYAVNSITSNVHCDDYDDVGYIKVDVATDEMIDEIKEELGCHICSVLGYTIPQSIKSYANASDAVIDFEDPPADVMFWSKIYLKEHNDVGTVTHEIGHAFGWDHTFARKGHLMSPFAGSPFAGQSVYGLDHYRDLEYYNER